jgi:CelD/BcsL family acetyltransferase involved in cellulose biosynthesis
LISGTVALSTATEYLASVPSHAASTHVFAKVEVHRDAGAVLSAWAELEAITPASFYQTRAFLLPWLETLGAARNIEPLFVLGKDGQDQVLALLCLGIERHGIFRSVVFLGGKESNFNFGLFRPGAEFAAADLTALLGAARSALGAEAPDVFLLKNQPFEWEKSQNPFSFLPHQASASFAYATALTSDADAFLAAKLSKEVRKKLRKKETRLSAFGPVELIENRTQDETRQILDAFFAEKIARCEEQGIDTEFSSPAMRDFFDRLSAEKDAGKSWLELYGLRVAGRIIATYAGAAHRGRFSGMINSFDTAPDIRKWSPGELLLTRIFVRQCEKRVASFDLGIGEAHYKETFCDITIPLFDVVMGFGLKGRLFASYLALHGRVKRAVKQDQRLLAMVHHWKRALLPRTPRSKP